MAMQALCALVCHLSGDLSWPPQTLLSFPCWAAVHGSRMGVNTETHPNSKSEIIFSLCGTMKTSVVQLRLLESFSCFRVPEELGAATQHDLSSYSLNGLNIVLFID